MRRKMDVCKRVKDKLNGTHTQDHFRRLACTQSHFIFIWSVEWHKSVAVWREDMEDQLITIIQETPALYYNTEKDCHWLAFQLLLYEWRVIVSHAGAEHTGYPAAGLTLGSVLFFTFAIVRIFDEGRHSRRPFHSCKFRFSVCDWRPLKLRNWTILRSVDLL